MLVAYSSYSAVTPLADYSAGTVVNPSFSPAPGTYSTGGSPSSGVVASATSGASIFYTLNGTASVQFKVSPTRARYRSLSTTTVKAMATKQNFVDSGVATGVYTITGPPVHLLSDGVAVPAISGAVDSRAVLTGSTFQQVRRSCALRSAGTSGDCDLYVRAGSLPTEDD